MRPTKVAAVGALSFWSRWNGRSPRRAGGGYPTRASCLVAIEADDEIAGWGECYGCAAVITAVVETMLAPRLIGRDPVDTSVVWEEHCSRVKDYGRVASFDSVIVRIDTDTDLTGWGEAKAGVGSTAGCTGLVAIIVHDPRDVSRLRDAMSNTPREGYAVARGHALPQLGRRVHSVSAVAGWTSRCGTSAARSAAFYPLLGGISRAILADAGGVALANRSRRR
jgi:L-alanine-DL-glutamate epimerase-like enolase superfamily enzyme